MFGCVVARRTSLPLDVVGLPGYERLTDAEKEARTQCVISVITVYTHTHTHARTHAHTHTHTRLTAPFPGLPGSASTRKVKPIWILLKQETASSSGISWAICKSASRSRQITMPVPQHSSFLQAGCPSCRPTNSVKALKASCVNLCYISHQKRS